MTSEQLQTARATLWRQSANPLLTLEESQEWLDRMGLCLYLPHRAQILAPAPSLVEAQLGAANPTPPRDAIERSRELLARMIGAGGAIPLNLFGSPADHPDFVVSREALPFVYALRGDRDWKHAPVRVSPLMTEIWGLLENRGALTASALREELGHEITEAAVLRGVHELWSMARVCPRYQPDAEPALWEPLKLHHRNAIKSGTNMSQVTALSALASGYLQSVIAASSEDAEAFLSPLASRSRVRDVLHGLTATRQLATISVGTKSLLYVEGTLPEFPEVEAPLGAQQTFVPRPRTPALPTPRPSKPEWKTARPSREPRYRPEDSSRPPAKRFARPGIGSNTGFPSRKRSQGVGERPYDSRKTEPREGSGPKRNKQRWRDLPGGRPDQIGKPKRFDPRWKNVQGSNRPQGDQDASSSRSLDPAFKKAAPERGRPAKPERGRSKIGRQDEAPRARREQAGAFTRGDDRSGRRTKPGEKPDYEGRRRFTGPEGPGPRRASGEGRSKDAGAERKSFDRTGKRPSDPARPFDPSKRFGNKSSSGRRFGPRPGATAGPGSGPKNKRDSRPNPSRPGRPFGFRRRPE